MYDDDLYRNDNGIYDNDGAKLNKMHIEHFMYMNGMVWGSQRGGGGVGAGGEMEVDAQKLLPHWNWFHAAIHGKQRCHARSYRFVQGYEKFCNFLWELIYYSKGNLDTVFQ